MDNKKLGKFISELRSEKNITQEQLAKELHVDRGTISKWERGVYSPTSDMLPKISNFFGINVSELYEGKHVDKKDINKVTTNIIEKNRKKAKQTIIISIFIIMILIISFLTYYFINNYNSISVHTLNIDNDKFNINNGIMIMSKEKVYIKLGEIQTYDDYEINYIRVYYKKDNKEYNIYKTSKIETTIINIFGEDEIFPYKDVNYIKENMYIDITYNKKEYETIKVIIKKDFSNTSIINKNNINNDIENNNVKYDIPEYIEDNFELDKEQNRYYREYEKDNVDITEYYFYDFKNYVVVENYPTYMRNYEYSFMDDAVTIYITIENNIEDNFIYNFTNEKCETGKCDSKIINEFNEKYFFWNN